MYNLFLNLYEQQKKLKTLFIANLIVTGILYAVLLYFGMRVAGTSNDSVSITLAYFFIFIASFTLIQIVITGIMFTSANKKNTELANRINHYAIDNNLADEKYKELTPSQMFDALKKVSNNEEFEKELKKFMDEIS